MLVDEQEAIDEVMQFKLAGGGTMVDTTTRGLGRDPLALRRISAATGLHISTGAGYYVYLAHPPDMDERSEDSLYEEMVRDINVGVGDSGIRCGHIGEIGCERQTPNEMKVVRAAARAQRATGAMLNIHQIYYPGELSAHTIADAIESVGGDLNRTVFSHMDGTEVDFEYQVSLIERGITIEYDVFGLENYFPSLDLQLPLDTQRVQGIKRLIGAGHVGRIVVAQDICMKMMMEKYGGWGYGHILKRVLPRFRRAGVTDEQLTAMLVDNPRRLLPFAAPQA
jgi:phosphotriesterase-related protein